MPLGLFWVAGVLLVHSVQLPISRGVVLGHCSRRSRLHTTILAGRVMDSWLTAAYHTHADEQAERANRLVETTLKCMLIGRHGSDNDARDHQRCGAHTVRYGVIEPILRASRVSTPMLRRPLPREEEEGYVPVEHCW